MTFPKFKTKIAGISHSNERGVSIQSILPQLHINQRITLIRDKENIYDPNAIKVYSQSGHHIGYIERTLAAELSPTIDSNPCLSLEGIITEITSDGKYYDCYISVWLNSIKDTSNDIYSSSTNKQKNELFSGKTYASFFIIALSLFIIVFAIIYKSDIKNNKSDIKNNKSVDKSLITLNEYHDLEIGMSISEVYDIVGSFGTQIAETKIDDYHSQVYEYKGYGEIGANAILYFTNRKLESKTQYGLEYYFSDEEVKEVNTPKQSPISIDDLKFSFNILPPNLIGTVYVEATYTNNTSFPITSLSLKYLRNDENEVSYLTYYSTVMPGDTSAKFDSFGPETQLLTDIELIECSITLTNELNEKIYINYDYKLNTYKVY